ncbi:MAG: AbrB family transcriptional regulator [Lactobacillus sp.]|jgi:hypothetical protein|nr:AbrB family transcriptional regulator [Lactobacillus sp.]MCH3906265.1 AbrB family transcriptional regulator [Lactobacillus sp.]MCH3990159.1 AbrB family transcriptional regulator [Lactobacillus sp.]MCH4069127.1 AbrB family transcriptional regulator [Lactobacillus sp.]MCI1303886.1 AbrB family transcriptional regulator [Lactobacillus sp.]
MRVPIENTSKKRINVSKMDFWKIIAKQQNKYGKIDTSEIDWHNDLGSERID